MLPGINLFFWGDELLAQHRCADDAGIRAELRQLNARRRERLVQHIAPRFRTNSVQQEVACFAYAAAQHDNLRVVRSTRLATS